MEGMEMSTRQRYIIKALELFSQRGFEAVSLADIAEAVGLTKPALYKHFKSKQELFDEIIKMSDEGFAARMEALQVNFDRHPERKQQYGSITAEEMEKRVVQLFLHTAFDPLPRQFRQLMAVEQFHMPEIARKYNSRYVECQYDEYEALFRVLMEAGKIKQTDPRMLAVAFVSPVIVMVGVCDREPEKKDEAVEIIRAHVREFYKVYGA